MNLSYIFNRGIVLLLCLRILKVFFDSMKKMWYLFQNVQQKKNISRKYFFGYDIGMKNRRYVFQVDIRQDQELKFGFFICWC